MATLTREWNAYCCWLGIHSHCTHTHERLTP
jgi:hypothetical protein